MTRNQTAGAALKKVPGILNQNATAPFQWSNGHAPANRLAPGMTPPASPDRRFTTNHQHARTTMEISTDSLDWCPTVTERAPSVPEVFHVGPALIHRRTGRVESPRGERWLRAKELELIVHLYEHVTRTFSRENLLQMVWNCHPDLITRTVDQTMATLRQKIEPHPETPRFLQTVYGIGYRLVL
jgi:DNA-binding response OmpR family regulator